MATSLDTSIWPNVQGQISLGRRGSDVRAREFCSFQPVEGIRNGHRRMGRAHLRGGTLRAPAPDETPATSSTRVLTGSETTPASTSETILNRGWSGFS